MSDTSRPRRLLVVHHTSSPGMQAMLEAALAGANDDLITGLFCSHTSRRQKGARCAVTSGV